MRITKIFLLKLRQLSRRRDRIPNLASIHFLFRKIVDVVGDVVVVDVCLPKEFEAVHEIPPYFAAGGSVKFFIVKGELDAGFEGRVEGADAVGGED